MAEKDLYAVLGITKEATAKDIQRASAKATIQYHPDSVSKKHPNLSGPELEVKKEEAKQMLQAVDEAVKILKDDKLRKIYDQSGYDAVMKAMKPSATSSNGPVNTGVKIVNDAHQKPPTYSLENMGKDYEKWNKQEESGKPKAPVEVDSSVNSGRNARLARFSNLTNNQPASEQPPAQKPVTNVVQRNTPPAAPEKPAVTKPEPIAKKLEEASEQVKDSVTAAFNNSVAIPLDTLQSISENLQALVDQINTEIRKAKGYKI